MTKTVLVNKENLIKNNYFKRLKLIDTKDIEDEPVQIEEETYKAYLDLKEYLKKQDLEIGIESGYRSIETQQQIMTDFIEKYGEEYAIKTVALPRTSEHHTGLAIDIAFKVNGKFPTDNYEIMKYESIYKEIIHGILHKFGFILRYPENKEKITGYSYEPWHIRYVGKFVAKIIYENNYTLEEYLKKYQGIILVNKEPNMTSFDVVNEISKLFGIKKVGHTGTLDPLAEGVLIVAIGQATKVVELITANEKEYVAGVILGIKTDTLDITGKVIGVKEIPSTNNLENTINSFKKTYLQEVPIYSAVKVNGKKLYEYARENKEVTLPKKEVTIKEIELLTSDNETFKFRAVVSKGTYIRSLINDIGTSLNTYATMTTLKRTKQGKVTLDMTSTLEEIKENKATIYNIDDILDYPVQVVEKQIEEDIIHGRKLENKDNIKDKVIFKDKTNKILGIYEAADSNTLKTWKNFNI